MPSSTEELIRIILSVDGQEGVKALEQQLKLNADAAESLKREFAAGNVTFDEFISKSKKLAATGSELQNYHDQMQTGSKLSAQGLLKLGNTLDDLQYVAEMGLRPIINNVMQIAPAIGIAMIAAELLRKKFGEEIVEAFGFTTKGIETTEKQIDNLKKKIDELAAKPYKVGVDFTDLDKAKADLDALEEREKNRAAASGDATSGAFKSDIAKTVRESLGGRNSLVAALSEIERATGFEHAPQELLDQKKTLEARIANPTYNEFGQPIIGGAADEAALAGIKRQITDSVGEYVAKSIVDPFLAGDPGGINAVKKAVQSNPGMFGKVGISGVSGADAINAMPGSLDEFLRAKDIDREIESTDEKDKLNLTERNEARKKRLKAEKEVEDIRKKGRDEINKEEAEIDKFLSGPDKFDQFEDDTEKAARVKRQQEAMGFIATQRKEDIKARTRNALDPAGAAAAQLQKKAQEHLQDANLRAGMPRQEAADQAAVYAPMLADLVARGANVSVATNAVQQQMLARLRSADEAIRRAEAELRRTMDQFGRIRAIPPSIQQVPFAN